MDQTIFMYKKIAPTLDLVERAFSYNFNKLDSLESVELSKFCAALAQYLVYMRYQRNKLKMKILKIKQEIERIVFHLLGQEILKKFKTKADAREYLISNNASLSSMRKALDKLNYELIMTEGMDKTILELINALKRELTRRGEELSFSKMNRR